MHKRGLLLLAAILAALLSLSVAAAACGGDEEEPVPTEPVAPTATEAPETLTETPSEATAVDVSLKEFEIGLSMDSALADTVTFNVSNDGTVLHNFRVIRTEDDPADLPVDEDTFMVDETQVDVAASSDDLDAGQTEEVTADLEAGSYVLICNVPTHYDAGMRTAFTVE